MIEVRNIEKTNLNKVAFLKLLKKFAKSKKDILVSFDGRLCTFGCYSFNIEKRRHEIKISSKIFQFNDPASNVYELIGTLLHEVKHLQQKEDLGTNIFESKKFGCNKRIKDQEASEYYSPCEIEARAFEEKNIDVAVEFYYKTCDTMLD